MANLTTLRRSPLDGQSVDVSVGGELGGRHVRLAEWAFLTMVSVRVAPATPAAENVERVLGTSLPAACGQVSEAGAHHVLWLGPDEWLVVSQIDAAILVKALEEAVAGSHAAVVDVSANRTLLELSGPAARAVLEKGCPVDLHPRAFRPQTAVTTTLARVPVLLWQSGPDHYRLLPRASFADYVARWLLDAMVEFGSDDQDGGRT